MNIYYQFTMHGRIKVERKYLSEVIHDTRREWSYETIENYMDKVKTAKAIKGVPANELFHLLNRINVKHAKVLVIGAHTPWVEATALQAGARETHTVEAFHIKSDDKRMITYSYSQFAYYYLHKKLPQFDLVISYSMLEHIGLGRYGDALNPWGDVMTLAMAWCAAAPNAKLILQVPRAKTDKLLFNLHRYYGPKRLPFVTTNWAPITMGSDSESHMPLYGERARAQVYQRMA